MTLEDEVRGVLCEELKLEGVIPETLKPGTPLFGPEGLGLDSIDALELVVILRKRFKADIPDRKIGEQALKTFGTLVEFIRGARKTG